MKEVIQISLILLCIASCIMFIAKASVVGVGLSLLALIYVGESYK